MRRLLETPFVLPRKGRVGRQRRPWSQTPRPFEKAGIAPMPRRKSMHCCLTSLAPRTRMERSVITMPLIGLDDTDTAESTGTGHLARLIATTLAAEYPVLGVTRHQLLVDPRVPCTRNNSSAAITLATNGDLDPHILLERVRALVLDHFQPGSDPGLCLAHTVPSAVSEFGRRAQRQLVGQDEARALAAAHSISLLGLGGDEGGVIGALAAVGLAANGEDGRYVLVGRSRQLSGLQPISALLEAGIAAVQTPDGRPVTNGLVQTDKIRPARRGGRPVAVVEWTGDHWQPLKLD
jgi:hypothetical protein